MNGIFSDKILQARLLCGIGVTLLLLVALAPKANAQAGTTIVTSPSPKYIPQGQTKTVDVVINDYNDPNNPSLGLYGADVRLTFDKNLVTVVDDNPFQTGVQVTPGPLLAAGFTVLNTADNTAGTIQYASTQLLPSSPVVCPSPPTPCSGVLFTIHLAGNVGGTSPLNFYYQKLSNPNGFQIPATTTNGSAIVFVPTAATVTSFQGTPAGNDLARLQWATGSETDLLGFNLWRSENETLSYAKLNAAIIPAKSPGEITGNDYEFGDTTVKAGKTYFYKLEAVKAGGDPEWSGPVAVGVAAGCATKPEKAGLLSPAAGAVVAPTVTLDWTEVACAKSYRVQIRRDSSHGMRVENSLVAASTLTTMQERGHVYFWRVRAIAEKRHGGWTEWRSFTVR